jgi:hypothetical protein
MGGVVDSRSVGFKSEAAMPNPSEELVHIHDDGSARELTETEKKYVDTEFSPFDGARPYIKSLFPAHRVR